MLWKVHMSQRMYDEIDCCEIEDYVFHISKIQNDGFDNFYNVDYWICRNCGTQRLVSTLIPEDDGKKVSK